MFHHQFHRLIKWPSCIHPSFVRKGISTPRKFWYIRLRMSSFWLSIIDWKFQSGNRQYGKLWPRQNALSLPRHTRATRTSLVAPPPISIATRIQIQSSGFFPAIYVRPAQGIWLHHKNSIHMTPDKSDIHSFVHSQGHAYDDKHNTPSEIYYPVQSQLPYPFVNSRHIEKAKVFPTLYNDCNHTPRSRHWWGYGIY